MPLISTHKNIFLLTLSVNISNSPLPSPKSNAGGSKSIEKEDQCQIFSGNVTCKLIIEQQNCMKFGRPDTEFMKWRWKRDASCCELPLFDATQFLELVRGKSLAFLGDSVGKNQMQSLLCLFASDLYRGHFSQKYSSNTDYFKRYFYHDYNFTIATLWSPYLVKSRDADTSGNDINSLMSLYLDELDEACMANSGRTIRLCDSLSRTMVLSDTVCQLQRIQKGLPNSV
ncbi:PREDICTED: trichome birefringence [Prunus dulcis]|uniref:PREDICTED: trichome birefringence n=1 Tax=Prunus dulcis TaxID=3755 RepID=A0A5E4EJ66_PRUDU|nr:PREDICTED: trichome birefringence [Prunus dulcis]